MAKVEWGVKRTCQACTACFYDLNKSPITCPKCNSPYELVVQGRTRKGRQALLDDDKVAVIEDLELNDGDLESDVTGDDDLIDDDDLDAEIDGVADVSDERDDD